MPRLRTVTQESVRRFGIPALDDALLGGLPPHSTWVMQGAPGSGKTELAIRFVAEGLRQNEGALYLTATQSPSSIMTSLRRFVANADELLSTRRLAILDPSPFFTELRIGGGIRSDRHPASTWDEIFRFIQDVILQSRSVGARRVVIDPLTPLLLAAPGPLDRWDTSQMIAATFLENLGATTIFTHVESPDPAYAIAIAPIAAQVTGILAPRRQGTTIDLAIVKARGLALTQDVVTFSLA